MAAPKPSADPSYNWDPVIDAIIEVESGGDTNAKSGKYCGALQICPALVKECNNILKSMGVKKRYHLRDRFSRSKSREMFKLIQSHHNPSHNLEKAIRSWNGGQHYKKRSTNRYYRRVMAAIKRK